jgi:hypothetical protein
MREQSGSSWRRLKASAVAGVVAVALGSMVATTAHAAPVTHAVSTQQAKAAGGKQTVLKSEYGKARSKVVGTFGTAGTMTGTFTPKRFKAVGDQLVAVGKLQGELIKANGKSAGTVDQKVKLPVMMAEGSSLASGARLDCDVLNLVLGPLDLDLLGLQVHLDKVVLDIVAASGAGNLLGNLLCAVAGLLDAGGLLSQVSQILDAILALLRQ